MAFKNDGRWIFVQNPSLAGEYSTSFSGLTSEFASLLHM